MAAPQDPDQTPTDIEDEEPEFDDDDDDEEDDDDDDYDEQEASTPAARPDPAAERANLNTLLRRLTGGPVEVRVHDVIIRGNTKTRDSLIEAVVIDAFRSVSTMQDLLRAAQIANARLSSLGVFDSASIILDAGPAELPGTANVVIHVKEARNPVVGEIGIYSRPEARASSVEGSVKFKNMFGYGDIWDASGSYGWDQASLLSTGVSLPRFKAIPTPVTARLSLLSQDWLKLSSYKESLLGLSFGLLSTSHHDLAYDLTWRMLTDPSRMASKPIRRQLGHSLLSSVKYTYKIDRRDSHLRPTSGYAFLSKSQVGGLGPDSKSLRFIRQEFDVRGAIPLGICNAAVNLGISAGVIMPWGRGFMNTASPLPERFYMGGHSSPVCGFGLVSLLGFKSRGLGPTDSQRLVLGKHDNNGSSASPETDALGGDLAVTTFADLSFDLPLKLFRESGIHGHVFVNSGNLASLAGGEFKNFSPRKFMETFRSSAGFGLVVPTKLFRMEINYCYILKQFENDRGKTGIQFNFSSPS